MTQLNSKSIKTILQEALSKDGDFLKEMVKNIIQQLMEEERDQQVGVLSHQRDNSKSVFMWGQILNYQFFSSSSILLIILLTAIY